ncbi:hypothetical protein Btru_019150 [Bulinus truncatus]|nr:hypothetical protein Btru_019150 [Bulinus truncatus]
MIKLQQNKQPKNHVPEISGARVRDYYCEPNYGHRVDGGMHVCVGCGKGWWMQTGTQLCHPCGPGYYNDEDGASECKICDVRYLKASWASVSPDHCIPREPRKLGPCGHLIHQVHGHLIHQVLALISFTRSMRSSHPPGPCGHLIHQVLALISSTRPMWSSYLPGPYICKN